MTGTPAAPGHNAPVAVFVPALLRAGCGGLPVVTISATSVRDALAQLEAHYPTLYLGVCDETGAVRRHINLFVNMDNIRDIAGLDSGLTAGDELIILPAVSGG